jgi:RNA polymerase sigma factor (sigma-70 family)
MSYSSADENPLLSKTPQAWDGLIEAVGPASLLVVIESRMSAALRRQITPEDVLQDALLHAWRDRSQCEWRGLRSFRSWLLSIIDNRIREAADRLAAAKRGAGREALPISVFSGGGSQGDSAMPIGPVGSTTPSRIAIFHEQAESMREALNGLPDELRAVVRLRLFEQLSIEEIAAKLSIGPAAVRHRFRKGAELYHQKLQPLLTSRVTMSASKPRPAELENPLPHDEG